MKNLKNFATSTTVLSLNEMTKTKGGTTAPLTVTIETTIDICAIGPNGVVNSLYCDRRRKKVGVA